MTRNMYRVLLEAEEYAGKKFDYETLRRTQMEKYEAGEMDKVEDGANGKRGLEALKKVYAPLILDVVGSKPWTLEEILDAMREPIRQIGRRFGSKRGPTPEEMENVAAVAVLDALATDKGKSPFAQYAIVHAKRKALRERKRMTDVIDAPQAKKDYGRRTVSIDQAQGEGEATMSSLLGDVPRAEPIKCPTCDGKGLVTPEGATRPRTCPTCGGTGTIPVPVDVEKEPTDPSARREIHDRLLAQRALVNYIFNMAKSTGEYPMTYLHEIVVKLRLNLDGYAEKEEREFPQIAKILRASEEIESIREYAQDHNRIDEFDRIINKYIPNLDEEIEIHGSMPLVIARLFSSTAEEIDGKTVLGKPKIGSLMDELRNTFTNEFEKDPRSNKVIRDYFTKGMKKIQKISEEFPGIRKYFEEEFAKLYMRETKECIKDILEYNYLITLKCIAEGTADPQDVDLTYIY